MDPRLSSEVLYLEQDVRAGENIDRGGERNQQLGQQRCLCSETLKKHLQNNRPASCRCLRLKLKLAGQLQMRTAKSRPMTSALLNIISYI